MLFPPSWFLSISLPPFLSQGLAHIWNSLKAEMTSLAPITILKIPFFPPSSPLALPCSLLAPSFFPLCRCIHVHFIFICLFLLVYRECIRGARLWCARILFISHVHTRARTHIPWNLLSLVCVCSNGSAARLGQSAALTENSICLSFLHKRKWHKRALPGIICIDRTEGHFKVQSSSFTNGQWKWL